MPFVEKDDLGRAKGQAGSPFAIDVAGQVAHLQERCHQPVTSTRAGELFGGRAPYGTSLDFRKERFESIKAAQSRRELCQLPQSPIRDGRRSWFASAFGGVPGLFPGCQWLRRFLQASLRAAGRYPPSLISRVKRRPRFCSDCGAAA
jgi:hypothetical protein